MDRRIMKKETVIALVLTVVALQVYGQCTQPCAGWTGNETSTTTPASVGIGSGASPDHALRVVGDAIAVRDSANTSGQVIIYDGTITKQSGDYFVWNTGVRLSNPAGGKSLLLGTAPIAGVNYTIQSDSFLALYTGATPAERMRIDTTGKVGIGTLAPSEKLEVNGSVYVNAENSAVIVDAAGYERMGLVKQNGFAPEIRYASPLPLVVRRVTAGTLTSPTASDVSMSFGQDGNVSVGTTGGGSKLTVAGTVESTSNGFKFPDGTTQGTAFAPSSGGLLSVNVAFGVGAPVFVSNLGFGGAGSAILDLRNASSSYVLHGTNSSQESAFSTRGSGAYIDVAGHPTPANNFIAFRTTNTASSYAAVEAMRITSSGSVEIGTPTPDPSLRLNVNGNATITGTLTANSVVNAVFGQDVAEWVRGDRELAAGTVVIVSPDKTNEVMPSSTAYDTTVAGVVSAQPGVVLGRPGALKATVATSGRVRVRVDARKGAIHVGDLLVTSDEPGTAMKSQPIEVGGRKLHQPGTILGKALEPLPDGVGEILVLLCLG
jgi:hypothetical protein